MTDFANPIVLSGSFPITRYDDEFNVNEDIWYSWTSNYTGEVFFSTHPSTTPLYYVAVYTGNDASSLTTIAYTDSWSNYNNYLDSNHLTFEAISGTTYRIYLQKYYNYFPQKIGLYLGQTQPSAPDNDNFANATTISGILPQTISHINLNWATLEAQEPNTWPKTYNKPSIWYSWTATFTGKITLQFDFFNRQYHHFLIYTGNSLGTLQNLYSGNRNYYSSGDPIQVTQGTTYKIQIFTNYNAYLNDTNVILRQFVEPDNNNFSNAITIYPDNNINGINGTTVDATTETNEPLSLYHLNGSFRNTVWYKWVATTNNFYEVLVKPTDDPLIYWDPVISVYTGSSLTNLVKVAQADEYGSNRRDKTYFQAVNETTYYIQIGSWTSNDFDYSGYGRFGSTFNLTFKQFTKNSNDSFSSATLLSGALPITLNQQSNAGATIEINEPIQVNYYGDEQNYLGETIWYKWIPNSNGTYKFSLNFTSEKAYWYDIITTLYTGSTISSLTRLDQSVNNDGIGDEQNIYFDAIAGQTYYFQIASYFVYSFYSGFDVSSDVSNIFYSWSRSAQFNINLSAASHPINDNFANATLINVPIINDTTITVSGSNIGASFEVDEPIYYSSNYLTKTVWYKWKPYFSGYGYIYTSNFSEINGAIEYIGFFTGTDLNNLTSISENESFYPSLNINFNAGETYYIRLGMIYGSYYSETNFDLSMSFYYVDLPLFTGWGIPIS